ncbi:MAG TPA: hypothetical protein VFY65_03260 [Longimicrobium sp.]|nr:hypothetical protein [Longimicrobium sp.]
MNTTLRTRTYPLEESGIEVPGVLVGVCDVCDEIVTIPHQSTYRLRDARVRRKEQSLEARVPTHLEDVIHMVADRFGAPVQEFRPGLLRFYLRELADDPKFAERVRTLAHSDLAQAPARGRVSLRVPAPLLSRARERAREVGISTAAEMLRGILLAAKEDVLDNGDPERILRLGGAAQAQGAARPDATPHLGVRRKKAPRE